MSIASEEKCGVVLMTYGSATTAEQVQVYFDRIYQGKASAALVADFKRRYELVGESPLIEITNKQAVLLEKKLGNNYVVRAGMLHSAPFIKDAVAACRDAGSASLVGIILSPQYSALIMEKYHTAFAETALAAGLPQEIAAPWPTEEHFIELLALNIGESLAAIKKESGISAPVIFTTHSLPQRVVERDPAYLEQLRATIDAVRSRLGGALREWYAAYQSAGHTPEEWLKPELVDVLATLHERKERAVLIVPIQFLTDHLEVLYDLDIAARKQCEGFGIAYHRIAMPNTHPYFIEALESVVKRAIY